MLSETNTQRLSVLVHSMLGAAAGYASLYISRGLYALVFSVLFLLVIGFASSKTFAKGKDNKWWLGNGGAVYLLVWFITWILFFNLFTVPAKIF